MGQTSFHTMTLSQPRSFEESALRAHKNGQIIAKTLKILWSCFTAFMHVYVSVCMCVWLVRFFFGCFTWNWFLFILNVELDELLYVTHRH